MNNDSKTKLVKAKAMPKSKVNVNKEAWAKVSGFYYKFVDAVGGGDRDNIAVSPVSAFLVLAMAAECSAGQTRQEILDAMGIKMSDVKKFVRNICYSLNRSLGYKSPNLIKSLNSFWASDKLFFKEGSLSVLSEHYCCDIFRTDFSSDEANAQIHDFIKKETNGLLFVEPEFSKNTFFTLINVLYVKDIWRSNSKPLEEYGNIDFINSDNSIVQKMLFAGEYCDGRAMVSEKCRKFYTETCHWLRLTFVVPNEGYSVNDIYNSECLEDIVPYEFIDERYCYHTRCLFPEFKASFADSIKLGIEKMGMGRLFYSDKCAWVIFLKVAGNKSAFCDDLMQFVNFEVTKKGVEAAAATMGRMCTGWPRGFELEQVYEDFIVDRAFAYKFEDEHGNVLFTGVVNKLD